MNFAEALVYLLSLGHETLAIKLGLANTKRLLDALERPHEDFPSIQIAGTNGKGSTAIMLESICRAANINAGLYTSPHLVNITERIRIGGQQISQTEFARLATQVREAAERLQSDGALATLPTFFEHITAIAFLAFKEARVQLAILETGLGGRLDATTTACALTVAITPIALDHQQYLGETLAEIAFEKAAIIRPGVIAIIAPQTPAALEVIKHRCRECDVAPRFVQDEVEMTASVDGRVRLNFKTGQDDYEDVQLGLRGRHQATNALVAIACAEALRERGFNIERAAIVAGLETAQHAGRLELRAGQPPMLFDGAHNPAGARALRDYLDEFVHVPLTIIFGAMQDKNISEIAATLFPAAHKLILTQPDNPRAATTEMLARFAPPEIDVTRIMHAHTVAEALQLAHSNTPPDGLICVTGSLYLIGEAQSISR